LLTHIVSLFMKIYTMTGDDGSTSLAGGKRVPKFHERVEAFGSVDELNSWIGLLRDFKENKGRRDILIYIQDQLMRCSVVLAAENINTININSLPYADCSVKIEAEIDKMDSLLPECKNFILPGGNIVVSNCQIARCVCRRAERAVIKLKYSEEVPEIIIKFLNRLSDYLFVLSRLISLELGNQDIIWKV
jgi:cob(I)alamin adenosyltransferase